MRLTLRTLLAWRDGLLSADDTQEIGRRVESSLTARLMAGRIDAVTSGDMPLRHAAIAAAGSSLPGRAGPIAEGLCTLNDIAEYIANRLPPDRMASFEKECLQSEGLLSEVAGCHRLIAELERESALSVEAAPDEVARVQEALRALSRRQPHGPPSAPERPSANDGPSLTLDRGSHRGGESPEVSPLASDAAKTDSSTTPRGERARPGGLLGAWSAAVAAMLLVAALMLALMLVLRTPRSASPGRALAERAALPAEQPGEGQAPAAAPEDTPPTDGGMAPLPTDETADTVAATPEEASAAAPEAARKTGVEPRERASPGPDETAVAVATGVASVPAQEADGSSRGPEASRARPVPGGDAMAIAAPPAGESANRSDPGTLPADRRVVPAEGASEDENPSVGGSVVGSFTETPLIFVRRRAGPAADEHEQAAADASAADGGETVGWHVARADESIRSGDELLVPGAFLPDVTIGGSSLRLFPMTRLRVEDAAADGTVAIELLEGRVAVLATAGGLPVRIGGLAGRLEAPPGAVVGMEISRSLPEGIDPLLASREGRADLIAVESAALRFPAGGRWIPGGGGVAEQDGTAPGEQDTAVAPGTLLAWSSQDPGTVRTAALDPGRDWAEFPVPPERIERMAAEELTARVGAVSPVERALRELSVDTQVEHRLAAAEALAAMGRCEVMVEMLCADSAADDLSSTQWRSLVERALMPALARGPRQAEGVLAALEDRAPHGEAGRLYAFAVGFSDAELADGAAEDLVTALDHPELVVRRFAAWRLEQIVRPKASERLRYRAERSPTLRADGVRWWRQQLEKGLIRRGPAGGLSSG